MIPTRKEIRELEAETWKLYDACTTNIAEKNYLEAVAEALGWVLDGGDDPLADSRE